MFPNASQLKSSELPSTVHALRIQLAQITRTLADLERGLAEQAEPTRKRLTASSLDVGYALFGQAFRVTDGSEILIEVLRHLAELEPDFPERYSPVVRKLGRKRPYVARTREGLYPGKPRLLGQTAEFAPGWFVGTNEGNEKKLDLLRCACQVLGLKWDGDLQVRMP